MVSEKDESSRMGEGSRPSSFCRLDVVDQSGERERAMYDDVMVEHENENTGTFLSESVRVDCRGLRAR